MKKKFRISVLEIEMIFGALVFGAVMCLVNSYNGYREFQKELEVIYGTVTEQFAQTAATYVNNQKIDLLQNVMGRADMNLALPININKEISCSQLLGLINPPS